MFLSWAASLAYKVFGKDRKLQEDISRVCSEEPRGGEVTRTFSIDSINNELSHKFVGKSEFERYADWYGREELWARYLHHDRPIWLSIKCSGAETFEPRDHEVLKCDATFAILEKYYKI